MSIISNAKELADLGQKLGDAELYRRIVELEGEIVDLSRENLELRYGYQAIMSVSLYD